VRLGSEVSRCAGESGVADRRLKDHFFIMKRSVRCRAGHEFAVSLRLSQLPVRKELHPVGWPVTSYSRIQMNTPSLGQRAPAGDVFLHVNAKLGRFHGHQRPL